MASLPLFAPGAPPLTGASSTWMPFAWSSRCTSRMRDGEFVERSNHAAPERSTGLSSAAIALRQAGALPDVAEHHLVGELAELWKSISDLADGGRRRCASSHCEPPGGFESGDSIMQLYAPNRATRIAVRVDAARGVARA